MEIKDEKKACGLCCTKIENISVKYGNEYVLKNVSIHIHCGQLTVIIGKNGAGKSTLLKAILGELKHEGDIVFTNEKIDKKEKLRIGYVPQKLSIEKHNPTSVLDLISSNLTNKPLSFIKDNKIYNIVLEYLKKFDAQDLINKKLGELSGGQLQRVLLSYATILKPELLILDEPVSGIDVNGTKLFYQIIDKLKKEYDMAIILVSHDFNQVFEYADNVILLDKKIIKQGKPKEVFESDEFIQYFGSEIVEGGKKVAINI